MNILNIHGYHGTPYNAAFEALSALKEEITSPAIDYDSQAPHDILQMVKELCVNEGSDLIVGTSLGGYFALSLAIELEKPVILVNPCLQPEKVLPVLGYEGDISWFAPLLMHDRSKVYCVIGDRDEIIGDHSYTKELLGERNIEVVHGGMHAGATLNLDRYFPDILEQIRRELS